MHSMASITIPKNKRPIRVSISVFYICGSPKTTRA
jgi:hypothetical protein